MTIFFFILAVLAVASAVGVVASSNPIHSALCLVGNLFIVACCYASLDAHFLAAVQVIVYAGAIMVLVLFVLMLLNVKLEIPQRRSLAGVLLAGVLSAVLVGVLIPTLSSAFARFDGAYGLPGTVQAFGRLLFTEYYFLFQLSGLILIVALVGAFLLARQRKGVVR